MKIKIIISFVLFILLAGLVTAAEIADMYKLNWEYEVNEGVDKVYASDLDNDGHKEIFVDSIISILALEDDGTFRWMFRTDETMEDEIFDFYVTDIDGDKCGELIVGSGIHTVTRNHCITSVVDKYGDLKWGRQAAGLVKCVYAADLDNDGYKEVIAGSEDKNIYVFDKDGELLWDFETGGGIKDIYATDLGIGDYGYKEVIVGSDNGEIYTFGTAINTKTKKIMRIREWEYTIDSSVESIYAADLDADIHKEVIIGSWDGWIYVLDRKGELIWTYKTNGAIRDVYATDLDDDVYGEVVVISNDNFVYVLDKNGKLKWKYEINDSIRGMSIADVDGGGYVEIIVGSDDNFVYVLDKNGNLKWKYETKEGVKDIYVVDLDLDKYKEIVVGSGGDEELIFEDHIYVFGITREYIKERQAKEKEANMDYERAVNYYDFKEYEDARFYALMAKETYVEIGISIGAFQCDLVIENATKYIDAAAYYKKADEYFRAKKFEDALTYARDAKEIYLELNESGKVEECDVIIDASTQWVETYLRGQANTFYENAQSYYQYRAYEDAVIYAERAKELYSRLEDWGGVSKCDSLIKQAIELFDAETKATSYYHLAMDYNKTDEYENAIIYAEKARSLYLALDKSDMAFLCDEIISRCTKMVEMFSKEERAYEKYKEAQGYYNSSDYENAITYAEQAKNIYLTLQNATMVSKCEDLIFSSKQILGLRERKQQADLYYDEALNYSKLNDYSNTIITADKARVLYMELNDTDMVFMCESLIQKAQAEKDKELLLYGVFGSIILVLGIILLIVGLKKVREITGRKDVGETAEMQHAYVLESMKELKGDIDGIQELLEEGEVDQDSKDDLKRRWEKMKDELSESERMKEEGVEAAPDLRPRELHVTKVVVEEGGG